MCELFGFTSKNKTDVTELLKKFYSHSNRHPHGWGIMYKENGSRKVLKEAVRACDSELLSDVISEISPQKNLLAHIRFATVGSIKKDNCHPFTAVDISGREWTMIHNGTIFSGKKSNRYASTQSGDTDSERLFLSLMDTVNTRLGRSGLNERARFELINSFIIDNAPRNKLNIMIFDGDLLYVHKNLKNTLSFKRTDSGIVFSTTPLDNGLWVPFPMTQVIAYKQGREVYRGDRHKGEFVPALDYIAAMDAMYI